MRQWTGGNKVHKDRHVLREDIECWAVVSMLPCWILGLMLTDWQIMLDLELVAIVRDPRTPNWVLARTTGAFGMLQISATITRICSAHRSVGWLGPVL